VPPEAVIGGLISIISVLSGAVVLLWRNHLAADERERKRADEANARLAEMVDVLKKAKPK
jgi:hypothetical protein